MSQEIISHCKSPIFSTFIHCPDCGSKLEEIPEISIPEQIQPNIIEPIKSFYPGTTILTGIILNTHLYTRSETTVFTHNDSISRSENHKEQAFNFITIKGKNGKQTKINIDGSDDSANQVHVGDAITIIETIPLHCTMPAPNGIKNMLNDSLADAFIVHNQDGSRYSSQNLSKSFTPHSPSIAKAASAGFSFFLVAAFLAVIVVLFAPHVAFKVPFSLSVFIGFLGFYFHLAAAKQHEKMVGAYVQVITSLRSITFKELGYHQHSPKNSDSDIFCSDCSTRCIPNSIHCTNCGTKLISESNIQKSDWTADKISNSSPTIKDKRLGLMQQFYSTTPEEKFEYKKFLGSIDHFTCSAESQVYRVLDRSVFAEKVVHRITVTGGESRTSSSTVTENVSIEGSVLVEDHNGNIEEMEVHSAIIGTLDSGDYLFVAHQKIKHHGEGSKTYRMIAKNLTKDVRVFPYDIRDYYSKSFLWSLMPYLLFPLAIYTGYNFDVINQTLSENFNFTFPRLSSELEPWKHWILGISSYFVPLFIGYLCSRSIEKSNEARAQKIVTPILDIYYSINQETIGELDKYK